MLYILFYIAQFPTYYIINTLRNILYFYIGIIINFDTFFKSLKNKVIPVFLLELFQASLLEE